MTDAESRPIAKTPLHALHVALGGKMVPFAGYELPIQYPAGILAEHLHTRAACGLFDVSHMGQARLSGAGAAAFLETLVPAEIAGLAPGRQTYTQFTNAAGGILDDLMVANAGDHLFLVVNAARKDADFALLTAALPPGLRLDILADRALIALQGPAASAVLARLAPETASLKFMTVGAAVLCGARCQLSRSGYTGEDGFEISIPADRAEDVARRLLAEAEVKPIGLGARDSLRLEAGLCLHGHDIDATTTPVEAGLAWSIGKRRRTEGGFPGDAVIRRQLAEGPPRLRVGLRPEGRQPAREGTEIRDGGGAPLGRITSGGFGPSVGGPIAMGYVPPAFAKSGTAVELVVRGKALPAKVAPMPFIAKRYAK